MSWNNFSLEEVFHNEKCVHFTEADIKNVKDAYKLASDLHHKQERHNKIPYIEHINRSVIIYLKKTLKNDKFCDPNNLIALILHDCIEDNEVWLISIIEKWFDINIIIDILWMSKPTEKVIKQVESLSEKYPYIFSEIMRKWFLDLFWIIRKSIPEKFIASILEWNNFSNIINQNIIELWFDTYSEKFEQQNDQKEKQKVYAEFIFLCMIACMPRELFRIKATERRDNMQDIEGLIKHKKVISAITTMKTTLSIYVPRAREVWDDSLAEALIDDRMNEYAEFVREWLIAE